MINKFNKNNEFWLSINQESKDNIKESLKEYDLDPRIIREIATPTPKSRIEFYSDHIYMILHFPAYKHTSISEKQEVDFIISKEGLITIQYENIVAVDILKKQIEVSEMISNKDENHFFIFTNLLKEMYTSLNNELLYIEEWSDKIVKNIFNGKQKEMVLEISKAIRQLLVFEKVIEPHERILQFLKDGSKKIINENFSNEVESMIVEINRLKKLIKNEIDVLKELRNTNESMLSSSQNQIMKTLTVITFIYLPINLIVDIFTMEARGTPILENPQAFYLIMFICLVTLVSMIMIARNKKWL